MLGLIKMFELNDDTVYLDHTSMHNLLNSTIGFRRHLKILLSKFYDIESFEIESKGRLNEIGGFYIKLNI